MRAEHPSGLPAWSDVWYFTTGDVVTTVSDHGRTVSSGVYLVRLATPSDTLTQRSMLLK